LVVLQSGDQKSKIRLPKVYFQDTYVVNPQKEVKFTSAGYSGTTLFIAAELKNN
jgi:hypothetical protein